MTKGIHVDRTLRFEGGGGVFFYKTSIPINIKNHDTSKQRHYRYNQLSLSNKHVTVRRKMQYKQSKDKSTHK